MKTKFWAKLRTAMRLPETRAEIVLPPPVKPKVFGIGLPRTGTTTLGTCLQILDYRLIEFDFQAFQELIHGNIETVLKIADDYDAFEDTPWFMLYQQFYARYPDSLFILTTRTDAATWLRSGKGHDKRVNEPGSAGEQAKNMFIQYYQERGVDFNNGEEVYTRHLREVEEFFADKPGRLLTVCWEQGDGWKQICSFLGRPIPDGVPFPHQNASPERSNLSG